MSMYLSQENPYSVFMGVDYTNLHPGHKHFKERKGEGPFSDYKDKPFDYDTFFAFFPEFDPSDAEDSGDRPQYTRSFIAGAAKQAAMFVKPTWCRELDGDDRLYAYFLTVAHMCVLIKQQQSGLVGTATPGFGSTAMMDTMPGVMTSASVGGVSVSKTGLFNPRNWWEFWYNQTPYGRTLMVFLEQQVAAGFIYEGEENIANCLRD